MRIINIILSLIVMAIIIGCDLNYKKSSPTIEPDYSYATIKNYNETIFGVTKNEAPIDALYMIYDLGTGEPVGKIAFNSEVTDNIGIILGICKDTNVTDGGVYGDCILNNKPEPVLPCPDTRDGTFPQSQDPQVCADHGYFYCSLSGYCLNKPINVNVCGEIGSQQRKDLNEN